MNIPCSGIFALQKCLRGHATSHCGGPHVCVNATYSICFDTHLFLRVCKSFSKRSNRRKHFCFDTRSVCFDTRSVCLFVCVNPSSRWEKSVASRDQGRRESGRRSTPVCLFVCSSQRNSSEITISTKPVATTSHRVGTTARKTSNRKRSERREIGRLSGQRAKRKWSLCARK